MAIAKVIKEGAKALAKKRGRPKVAKKRGRKPKVVREASAARQRKYQADVKSKGFSSAEQFRQQKKIDNVMGSSLSTNEKMQAVSLLKDNKKLSAADAVKQVTSGGTKRKQQRINLSGLTDAQKKERARLIAQVKKEMAAKGTKTPMPERTLKLTPQGEKLLNTKAGRDKIINNPKQYMYEGADAKLTPKMDKEVRKGMREDFADMSQTDKIEYLQKRFAPEMTSRQISDILGQNKSMVARPEKIINLFKKLTRQGYPFKKQSTSQKLAGAESKAMGKEVKRIEGQVSKIRNKEIPSVEKRIDTAKENLKRVTNTKRKNEIRQEITKLQNEKRRLSTVANTLERGKTSSAKKQATKMTSQQLGMSRLTPVTKKAGGKISRTPRGCGAAKRGYGKAMK